LSKSGAQIQKPGCTTDRGTSREHAAGGAAHAALEATENKSLEPRVVI